MNRLFYNIAGGVEQQIRREKRTTISEVIVRVKRNIMKNRNWFYFKFSVESSSFIFNNFKTEKFKLTFDGWNRPVCHLFRFTRVSFCLAKFVAFHPRTVKRIVMALMPSPLFRCFSLFLPHLRTLAQEKRSEIVFVLGLVGGVSVSIHYCRETSEYFSPCQQWPLAGKKILAKQSARAITVHYRDLEHAYVSWIWLHGSASYVIMLVSAMMGFMMRRGLILSFGASCRGWNQDNDFRDTTRSKWYKFENLAITRPFFCQRQVR